MSLGQKNNRSTFQIDADLMSAARSALRITPLSMKANLSVDRAKERLEELKKFGLVEETIERPGRSLKKQPVRKYKLTQKGLEALEIIDSTKLMVLNTPSQRPQIKTG